MNIETLLMMILNSVLDTLPELSIPAVTAAIVAGNATDEQLAEFTSIVHGEFDERDGCMVEVITELHNVDVPCYAINHAIRTYVRTCDKREAEAAERDASVNARYGKAAQSEKPGHLSMSLLGSQPGKCSNTKCWCWE